MVDLARLAYGSDAVVSHGDYLSGSPRLRLDEVDDISTKGERLPVPEGGVGKYRHASFVSRHFGFDFAKPLLSDRYSFTFLRNPVERVLSYYYFCLTRDTHEYEIYAVSQALTLDQFLMLGIERPALKACIWNNQAWQLADGYGNSKGQSILSFSPDEILELAIRHLDNFSYIGFAESFEEDRDYILKVLGLVPSKTKIVSNANPGRPTARDLPASTLELLAELTHLDRELYKVAWQRKPSFIEKHFKRWLPFK